MHELLATLAHVRARCEANVVEFMIDDERHALTLVERRGHQNVVGISTPTLVAFTTASTTTPGAKLSSSAASRVMSDTKR